MKSDKMAPMQWRKSPEQLIETFEAVAPSPPASLRKMFGYPAAFVNGNMFMGLFQEDMILRLPEADRAELLKINGARIFEPMPGRQMREYVVLPAGLLATREALRAWVAKALQYGETLKPKPGKSSKPKSGRTQRGKTQKPAGKTKKR
jgi:TfoX/Sxy family transcriptional regulator of competence genes